MKTDNELIAEFMGIQVYQTWAEMDAVPIDKLSIWSLPEQLDYHLNWSKLMPVVEKISENYDFTIQFYAGECNCYCTKQTDDAVDIPGVGHGGFTPKIESVYRSVVAFVKWHAKNKPLKY